MINGTNELRKLLYSVEKMSPLEIAGFKSLLCILISHTETLVFHLIHTFIKSTRNMYLLTKSNKF